MKILYVGDIMGPVGVEVMKRVLPILQKEHQIDLVIAQAENVTAGKGISLGDYKKLLSIGVDFLTGGNWTLHRKEIIPNLDDSNEPIIRPANYPPGTPGKGMKFVQTAQGQVQVISLLGQIVGKDADAPVDNPLVVIDKLLEETKHVKCIARIVNFHGDYSSEKKVIGYYLDGRVTAVIGDHWHVPTADAFVLPNGTAHITDVGMCGSLDSSLGIKLDTIIDRWKNNSVSRNVLEDTGRTQFSAVLIESDTETGLAKSITSIQKVFD